MTSGSNLEMDAPFSSCNNSYCTMFREPSARAVTTELISRARSWMPRSRDRWSTEKQHKHCMKLIFTHKAWLNDWSGRTWERHQPDSTRLNDLGMSDAPKKTKCGRRQKTLSAGGIRPLRRPAASSDDKLMESMKLVAGITRWWRKGNQNFWWHRTDFSPSAWSRTKRLLKRQSLHFPRQSIASTVHLVAAA